MWKPKANFINFLVFFTWNFSHFPWLFPAFTEICWPNFCLFACQMFSFQSQLKICIGRGLWEHSSKDLWRFFSLEHCVALRALRDLSWPGRESCFSHLSSFFALFSYLLRPFYAFSVNARCGCLRFGATFCPYSSPLCVFDLISVSPSLTHTHKQHPHCLIPPAVSAECVVCSMQRIVVYILREGDTSWSTIKPPLIKNIIPLIYFLVYIPFWFCKHEFVSSFFFLYATGLYL